MRTLDAVPLADVVDLVHLVGVGVDAAFAVAQQRAVVPGAFPQLVDDLGVLLGPLIALVVLLAFRQPEVARRVLQRAGDDVPADAPLGGVVEGGDLAGERERMILQHRTGDHQAEVLGGQRQGRNDRRRIVIRDLQALAQIGLPPAAVVVVQSDHVGEEDRVELPAFEELDQFDPRVELVELHTAGLGVAPRPVGDVGGGVHGEGVEDQPRAGHDADARTGTGRVQRFISRGAKPVRHTGITKTDGHAASSCCTRGGTARAPAGPAPRDRRRPPGRRATGRCSG